MTNVEHTLGLTCQALDEFESVPLAASLRRAMRIARQRGDIAYAHLFQLDLRPSGGSTAWSRTEAYELLKSEGVTVDVDQWRSRIFDEWVKERVPAKVEEPLKDTFGNGELIGGSIESVIRHSVQMERESEGAPPQRKYQMELRRELDLEVIERTAHRVFTYLCTVERDLSYIGINADILSGTGCVWNPSCRGSHRGCSNNSRPRTGVPGKTMLKARLMRSPRAAESSSRSRTWSTRLGQNRP
jgi:hypothetical protein